MGRVALIVLLSITAAAAADKDKGRFAPGPASSYRGHQTADKITIAAVPFINDEQTRAAFDKVNPNKYGVLPVLVILENGTGKALRLDLEAEYVDPGGRHLVAIPADDVQRVNGVTKPPKLVTFVPAVYPKDKHDAGITASVLLSAAIVLIYTFLGGLTSAIYNEVVQFFLIVAGFIPLVFLGLRDVGGWSGLRARLDEVATAQHYAPGAFSHSWSFMGSAADNPMGVEWFAMLMGLGFVLSFGYWCTDFLVIQRAMAANSMSASRRTPVLAALPKMMMPFIVIVPGIAALALSKMAVGYDLPMKNGGPDYDQVLTTLMGKFYPAGMLGVGLTGLMASFMSGMAGNVTAFNTVFTYDIYQSYIRKNAPDSHYLFVGRLTTVFGVLLSIGTAYLASSFNTINDFLQLVFSFVNAPLFATFLLGMFWKRATGNGAFFGLLSGTLAAAVTHGSTIAEGKGGWLAQIHTFPSSMAQNFWIAIMAWTTCFFVTIAVSLAAYAGTMLFAHRTILGKRIRAVASNPMLADITRLQPQTVYIYVIAIASALVCLPGILVPLDLGLQPYNGVTPLLTATIAMIAGGVGSITGAFVLSVAIAVLQNLSLLVMPGEWSIGVTFFIFVIFMLFRPTGLFAAAR
jgi:SSS family transporter